jgi:hypothetical protein
MKIGDHEIDYCIVAVKEFFEVVIKKKQFNKEQKYEKYSISKHRILGF